MTWEEENEGFTYKHIFKKIERLMDWIFCGCGKINFRGKSVDEIENRCGLWSWAFLGVLFEILDRLADLPYLDISYNLGNGCNLIKARHLKKPLEFYILFAFAELYGVWAFWYCIYRLKREMQKSGDYIKRNLSDGKCGLIFSLSNGVGCVSQKDRSVQDMEESIKLNDYSRPYRRPRNKKKIITYFSDDVRKLIMLMSGEIPLLMILEYFFVERPLGSDGFFANGWIATNNILTSIHIVLLILATIDVIVDNVIERDGKAQFEAKGIGSPDGRLDLFEVLIILNTICLFFAAITRVTVNSLKSAEWDNSFIQALKNNSDSNSTCLVFDYSIVFEAMHWYDVLYLILCGWALLCIIPVVLTVVMDCDFLSKIIVFKSKNSDQNKLDYFKIEIKRRYDKDEFLEFVKNFDDDHLIFLPCVSHVKGEFVSKKNLVAFYEVITSEKLSLQDLLSYSDAENRL
jgi:hypothetical protein